MSQTPPDEPKLPRLPDFPPVTPAPAEPPSTEPDPSIEPVPAFPDPSTPAAQAADPAGTTGGAGGGLPPEDDDRGLNGHDGDAAGPGRAEGKSGGKRLGLLVGGVVVVAVLVAGGLLLFGGDDDSATPESTVRAFFQASKEQDCDRLVELVVEESWSRNGTVTREKAIDECNAELGSDAEIEAELHEVKVTSEKGDKAVVQVNYSVADEKVDTELDLVKEDGDWKIDAV